VFINQQNKLNEDITGAGVYISLLPADTSTIISFHICYPAHILNWLDIT